MPSPSPHGLRTMDKQPNLPYLAGQIKFLFIPSRGLGSVTMHGLI